MMTDKQLPVNWFSNFLCPDFIFVSQDFLKDHIFYQKTNIPYFFPFQRECKVLLGMQ